MKRTLRRFMWSSRGRVLLAGLLLLAILAVFLEQQASRRDLSHLLGTARLNDARPPQQVQRVSLSRVGVEGNSDSYAPSISADGRYVAFVSAADNLVPDDDNQYHDVFLYDRHTDEIKRLSMGYDGTEANGPSREPVISRDGQVVAFISLADNLAPDDGNGVEDVFVYDRGDQSLSRVSIGSEGQEGNGRSMQPALSGDGRLVAFVSLADNLVPKDENRASDIFVHDRVLGETTRVSVSNDGQPANKTSKHPALSADGRFVAFQSRANNLDAADSDGMYDIFVHDRRTSTTELVSRSQDGSVGNHESLRPSLSDDGRFVAFESWADNLAARDENRISDVFVVDRDTGEVELVSVASAGEQANDVNGSAVISADGHLVAFASRADNLAPNDDNKQYDVYVHDRRNGETRLVSVNLEGRSASGVSISPSLTSAGLFVAFDSTANDLVRNDTNQHVDVFIFDTFAGVDLDHVVHLPLVVEP
ncbi:MAG: TolB family protein [Chloroflexota bacterium]